MSLLYIVYSLNKQYMNYYKILGINRNANQEEIIKAYKHQYNLHRYHSSVRHINEAYHILSNPFTRQVYDMNNRATGVINEIHSVMQMIDTVINHPESIEICIIDMAPPMFNKMQHYSPSFQPSHQFPSSPIIEEIIDEPPIPVLQIEDIKPEQNKWVIESFSDKNNKSKIGILNDAELEEIIKSTLINIKYVNP